MKIAILQPRLYYFVGGGEKIPYFHAIHLAKEGHEVDLYILKPNTQSESFLYKKLKEEAGQNENLTLKLLDVPSKYDFIYEIEAGNNRFRWDAECLMFNSLIQPRINEGNYDKVLSYYIFDSLILDENTESILYLVGNPSDDLDLRTAFLSRFDKIISISQNVNNVWEKHFTPELHNGKIFVHPTGTDVDIPEYAVRNNEKVELLFVGRLIDRKGIDVLINSVNELDEETKSKIKLTVVGDGPDRKEYEKAVNTFNLGDIIEFVGLQSNVESYFEKADICVFPSKYKEGLMGVVLESLASGCAVVTTTQNGNETVIESGKNGILIEPNDENTLTKVLTKLINEKSYREELGKTAHKRAREELKWETNIAELVKIIEK